MNLNSREGLIARLRRGRKAREQFVESHLGKRIAHQLRAIRDGAGWSQDRLAQEVGMNQNAISRLESPGYGKPTITTLKRLAAALDVGLVVHFVPFSQMIDWVSGTRRVDPGLTTESLAVPSFPTEEKAGIFSSQPARIWTIQPLDTAKFDVVSIEPIGIQESDGSHASFATETSWTGPPDRLPVGKAFSHTRTADLVELGKQHG